ncbi:MAG TPA: putative toxin-antitoxin system toxin component, PIN family [Candidatus Paceibacterota bacterium]
MIKAVLDTNVFVSALFWRGAPHTVVREGIAGAFTLISSPAIMVELREALVVKFQTPAEDVREYLRVIALNAFLVEPSNVPHVVLADANDDKIIACAVNAEADYIVSGDKHLLSLKKFFSIGIITPPAFLCVLKARLNSPL